MPAIVMGENTQHVRQEWVADADEALYGLGENQLGLFNLKGYDLDLWQHNGTIVIPFLVSSRGWGVLWDNTSFTRFGDLRELGAHPAPTASSTPAASAAASPRQYYSGADFKHLVGERRRPGHRHRAVQQGEEAQPAHYPACPRGTPASAGSGEVEPDGHRRLHVPDLLEQRHQAVDRRRAGHQPLAAGLAAVEGGRQGAARGQAPPQAPARVDQGPEHGDGAAALEAAAAVQRTLATPATTSLWSEVGDGIDYYFVYGPELDKVVAGYRRITGPAPMIPRWALGLWQSRQRYETSKASLDVVDGFRARGIPFDNIVQDWFYWKEDSWGSHEFDPVRFPDPDRWVRDIHAKHARLMISVWGKFYPGTKNFEAMRAHGFLYQRNLTEGLRDWVGDGGYPYTFYDAFNPEAGKLFWSQMERALFRKHVDAWWLDAPEPDLLPHADAGRATHAHEPHRPRLRGAHAERLLAGEQQDGLRRAAGGGARPARLHPDPLGVRRAAALRRGGLVGRHHLDLDGAARADPGRPRVVAVGRPVLVDGHRRLLRPGALRGRAPDAPTTPTSGAS